VLALPLALQASRSGTPLDQIIADITSANDLY